METFDVVLESIKKNSRVWASVWKPTQRLGPPTRLTQQHRREAKGESVKPPVAPPRAQRLCRICGVSLDGGSHCERCAVVSSTERMIEIAKRERVVAQRPEAQARRAGARLRNARTQAQWDPAMQPVWLTETAYREPDLPTSRRRDSSNLGADHGPVATVRCRGSRGAVPAASQALAGSVETCRLRATRVIWVWGL